MPIGCIANSLMPKGAYARKGRSSQAPDLPLFIHGGLTVASSGPAQLRCLVRADEHSDEVVHTPEALPLNNPAILTGVCEGSTGISQGHFT